MLWQSATTGGTRGSNTSFERSPARRLEGSWLAIAHGTRQLRSLRRGPHPVAHHRCSTAGGQSQRCVPRRTRVRRRPAQHRWNWIQQVKDATALLLGKESSSSENSKPPVDGGSVASTRGSARSVWERRGPSPLRDLSRQSPDNCGSRGVDTLLPAAPACLLQADSPSPEQSEQDQRDLRM